MGIALKNHVQLPFCHTNRVDAVEIEKVIPLLRMNGWLILSDETVQKFNAAYPLVVPHEAVGLKNINLFFFR